jgi:hypothetical protein
MASLQAMTLIDMLLYPHQEYAEVIMADELEKKQKNSWILPPPTP